MLTGVGSDDAATVISSGVGCSPKSTVVVNDLREQRSRGGRRVGHCRHPPLPRRRSAEYSHRVHSQRNGTFDYGPDIVELGEAESVALRVLPTGRRGWSESWLLRRPKTE